MKQNDNLEKAAAHKVPKLLFIAVGLAFTAAAVALGFLIGWNVQVKAIETPVLYTNAGTALPSGENQTVMDGACLYIGNYDEDTAVYYQITENKISDTTGIDLSTSGTRYVKDAFITMIKPATEAETLYLYIQQRDDVAASLDEYKFTFYEPLDAVTVSPTTSDTNITELKVGDEITFYGTGTIYYTLDGSTPAFTRDKSGDITVNDEKFLKTGTMEKLGVSNTLTVGPDWLSSATKDIRVIAYADESDFSQVVTFRYKITQDTAAAPVISPETSPDNPTVVTSGTEAALSTTTTGATILYTLDGTVPSYSIDPDSHEIIPDTNADPSKGTKIYTAKIPLIGKADAEVVVTAKAVKINPTDGSHITKDSASVQFVYYIAGMQRAAAPESTPQEGSEIALNSKIFLNSKTTGGIILYTTDGTTPTYEIKPINPDDESEGYKLSLGAATKRYGETQSYIEAAEPDARSGSQYLVQAKTIKFSESTGLKILEDSEVARFRFSIADLNTVSTPTAMPSTTSAQMSVVKAGDKIILACATAGSKIYYTTDGSAPVIRSDGTTSSSTYLYQSTGGITVPEKSGYFTITAKAVKAGMNDSAAVQFVYQYPATVSPPYVTPAEGMVSINTEVTLASLDTSAQIYYTLDGTEPSATTARLYSAPIMLTENTTIKAMCVLDGINSSVRTFIFTVSPELMPPLPSVASGSVVTAGSVITLTAQTGAAIYYTIDGSDPKQGSPMSGGAVSITGQAGETVTVKAYAKGSDYSDSQTATYLYTISSYENGIQANPENGARVHEGGVISLDSDVTNAVIYYAVGGDIPSLSGAYGTQVNVTAAEGETKFTLKAVAIPEGAAFPNKVATFLYDLIAKPVSPKASIPGGAVLLEAQSIVLSAQDCDIYYTLDGSTPDTKSDIYTDPIDITEDTLLQAIAVSDEEAQSEVAGFQYTFAPVAQAPRFSIAGGEVEEGTMLTMSSQTTGATIYYTMDGQIPNMNNTKNLYIYAGPITLNKAVNIKAISVKDKMSNSEVTGAIFTVKEQEISVEDGGDAQADNQNDSGRLMSRRSYLNADSGPAYDDFVLKNPGTGVVLSAQEGALPAEVRIEVEESPPDNTLHDAVKSKAGKEYGVISCFDISLWIDGEQVQPDGEVEIGLPIPQEYRNSAISAAYIDEDGNVEIYATRRDGDMAYVITNHFSRYCIIGPVNVGEETEKSSLVTFFQVGGVICIIAGYVFFRLGRRRRRSKEFED